MIAFDGFTLPRGLFEGGGQGLAGEATFSVRPQTISLLRSGRDDARVVEGRLVQRTFLGETWDYVVSPVHGELKLKVAAPPAEVFEVGDAVWMSFDPVQMAAVD